MKRKCVIFGTTDFGKMLRYYFEKYADVQIVAYTVDKAYLESDTYDGLPAVAYEEVEKAYPPTEYTMVIALGYKKMNQIRQQKFEDAKRKGYAKQVQNQLVELLNHKEFTSFEKQLKCFKSAT